ncbi:NUDIX domain-containing protein [Streptomyces sp. N2-109]|uniref:NUDIX domain-containing protein n=1 Tax=Streptomyces gossypii TaxID=2883101 RepID=A0ABT2JKJ3_9ACTN|nr:NUDIX domain-containing protein [Streptomyces gossypii]MCT2588397.1 NUDIX domain-containing protein [Streptomyces gossypii]
MSHADIDPARPPARRLGCVALLTDESGRVLMVNPTYEPGWILPGGGARAGERIADAAARELLEETGLVRQFTHFLTLDQVPAGADGTSAEGLNVVCEGGVLTPAETRALRVPAAAAAELSACALISPGELSLYAKPYQERRIRQALDALERGNELPLLELGEPMR